MTITNSEMQEKNVKSKRLSKKHTLKTKPSRKPYLPRNVLISFVHMLDIVVKDTGIQVATLTEHYWWGGHKTADMRYYRFPSRSQNKICQPTQARISRRIRADLLYS